VASETIGFHMNKFGLGVLRAFDMNIDMSLVIGMDVDFVINCKQSRFLFC